MKKKVYFLLLSFLFSNLCFFGQGNASFWFKIKSEAKNEKLLIKIEDQRKNAKVWDQIDQLKYHQFLAEINYELSRFESARIQSDYGVTLAKKLKNDSMQASFLRLKGRNFYFLLNKQQKIVE